MKTTSILALATALALCAPSLALAQTTTVTTDAAAAATTAANAAGNVGSTSATGAAGATATADANNDGTITAEEQSAFDADNTTTGSVSFDTNADGTITIDEIGTIDATIASGGDAGGSIDVDGNGTLSDEELANANIRLASLGGGVADDSVACSESGIEGTITSMGSLDMAMLGTATNVRVVLINDCDAADVQSALAAEGATGVRMALEANAAATAAVQSRGVTLGDVLGATTNGGVLTIYVAADIAG